MDDFYNLTSKKIDEKHAMYEVGIHAFRHVCDSISNDRSQAAGVICRVEKGNADLVYRQDTVARFFAEKGAIMMLPYATLVWEILPSADAALDRLAALLADFIVDRDQIQAAAE